ncbi:mechanosensitive ion channel family protein [Sulfurihydrogenibium sp.]|jgi:small-conductance mechanosensitive channel|uniref:mechanosensitive ion channel family protein n=1 Tax=Sulfurihydrogenibium sp. TaxID=2053621 RepID=UPI002625C56B|nr:mechanosensitive ion channel family protein [Sulfurihydrogenibium sp.]
MINDLLKNYEDLILFVGSFVVLYILRLTALRFLKTFRKRFKGLSHDILNTIYKSIKIPSLIWVILLSAHATVYLSKLPQNHINLITKVIDVLLIFSITILIANLSTRIVKLYLQNKNLPETGLIFILLQVFIYLIGILIMLSYLDISIMPIITTLGIGGLAIGLALKDTLSNIFSGLYILLEKNIKVGDFIELENGKKGYVTNINWRTTTIKTLSNDVVILPNEKLAQSIVVNFAKPVELTRVAIEIPISYDTDIDKFEKIVMEEVYNLAKENDKLLLDPAPVLRFIPGFGDSSLNFTLYFSAANYENGFLVQSELRKRILKRLKKEGIEIPYPQLDVHIKDIKKDSL